MQRRSQRCDELGLLACKPLEVPVQGAVRGYVLFSRHLLRSIPADEPPPLLVEGPDLPRNARKLPRDALVVQSPAGIDAAAKLSGIEHDLPNHLENFAFEDMGADLGIAAALDLRPIVHVLLGATIAAVHGPMIHAHLPRRAHDLVVASRR